MTCVVVYFAFYSPCNMHILSFMTRAVGLFYFLLTRVVGLFCRLWACIRFLCGVRASSGLFGGYVGPCRLLGTRF